jgi:hypothetical protein
MSWNERIREATKSGKDMSLDDILLTIAKTTSFEGCQDPRHNLRGFLAKAVLDGWMVRVEPGVFRQNLPRRGAGRAQFLETAPVVLESAESGPKEVKVQRRRRRRTNKTLKITIGDITLQTPPGMRPDAIHRLVEAIRGSH